MTAFSAIIASLALAASGQPQVSGGVTAPERTTHRYDILCGGRSGSVVLEERFDRRVPARSVAILGFTPLAGRFLYIYAYFVGHLGGRLLILSAAGASAKSFSASLHQPAALKS